MVENLVLKPLDLLHYHSVKPNTMEGDLFENGPGHSKRPENCPRQTEVHITRFFRYSHCLKWQRQCEHIYGQINGAASSTVYCRNDGPSNGQRIRKRDCGAGN